MSRKSFIVLIFNSSSAPAMIINSEHMGKYAGLSAGLRETTQSRLSSLSPFAHSHRGEVCVRLIGGFERVFRRPDIIVTTRKHAKMRVRSTPNQGDLIKTTWRLKLTGGFFFAFMIFPGR
jgi:hypothetical protein